MPDSPFTAREIESLAQSMRDLSGSLDRLRGEMATTYARKDVIEPRIAEVEKDVARHSGYWDWLVRLVIAAVIIALLGLLFTQGGGLS